MKQEFEKLLSLLKNPDQGSNNEEDMKQVFEESLDFFEKMAYQLKNGTGEEKKEIITSLTKAKDEIEKEIEGLCKQTGLSTEELTKLVSNPQNYTEDQWDMIQDAQQKLTNTSQEIQGIIKGDKPKKLGHKKNIHRKHKPPPIKG